MQKGLVITMLWWLGFFLKSYEKADFRFGLFDNSFIGIYRFVVLCWMELSDVASMAIYGSLDVCLAIVCCWHASFEDMRER